MADVFISYKSERRAAAEHLAEILADYGYSVWWDYGLVSGRDFGAQIEKELRAAKAVVVLWCSLSRESEWVLDEAGVAKNLGTIIPTMIERIDLPLGFGRARTLDLSDWDGAPQSHKLERLLRDIAAKIGRAPAPNQEGLDRTERAWRRFGAPSLASFALITPLERQAPPRTLPGAVSPHVLAPAPQAPHASRAPPDSPIRPARTLLFGAGAGAIALVLVGVLIGNVMRETDAPSPAAAATDVATTTPPDLVRTEAPGPAQDSAAGSAAPTPPPSETRQPAQSHAAVRQPATPAPERPRGSSFFLGTWRPDSAGCFTWYQFYMSGDELHHRLRVADAGAWTENGALRQTATGYADRSQNTFELSGGRLHTSSTCYYRATDAP